MFTLYLGIVVLYTNYKVIHSLTSTSCRDKILCNGLGSKGKITILESVMEMFEGL